ncbi:MAG: hypothetical protein KC592_09700, partial [Nitrospira sp.]|nr:hypothetical protein [Nitrospira sp.]
MSIEYDLLLLFSLVPVLLMAGHTMERTSPSAWWGVGIASMLIAGAGFLAFGWESEISSFVSLPAAAILLSCFCALLWQKDASRVSDDVVPIILLAVLGLGGVIGVVPINRLFMIGLLGYGGFYLSRHMAASLQKTLALVHLGLAVVFGIVTLFLDETGLMVAGLFLLVTFLPLVPFHLPFLGVVRSSRESLAGVWVVVWLATGLSQLKNLEELFHPEGMWIIPAFALVSALYASLKATGHLLPREGIAYAAITLLALLWGLLATFSHVAVWGVPYGIAVALLMSAMLQSFAFLHERYGTHNLVTLQGLGSGLPRFRGAFTFMISLVMLLPILPVVAGFLTIPLNGSETSLFPVLLLLCIVWFSVSW